MSSVSTPAKAPSLLRGYLELCRASNLPTVWTNVLAAVLLAGGSLTLPACAAALSVTLTYLGGMALNDVFDVDEDRVKKPLRPIPSGRISVRAAAIFAAALFAAGLALLLALCPWPTAAAGLALIATVHLYDALHSRNPATVLLMAACRALVFVIAALAVTGALPGLAALGAGVQFLYIVGLTLVARWEKSAERSFRVPPIPWLIAGVSLVDGLLLAAFVGPAWLLAGLAGFASTRLLQTQVRGD